MASFADIQIRFGADLKGFSTSMQNAQRSLKRIGADFQKVGAGLTVGVTTPLLALGGFALDAAADFETLNSRLAVALGSTSAANETFKKIAAFTKDIAVTTEEAADSYIKLKNLGLDPTIEALESYGNTAAAQGKSVNQLIEAVADAATGEFERLKEFGIKASKEGEKVTFTFQGLSTTIGNNAQEIQGYLQELGKTTFAGSLEAQANTFNGIVAIIKDNVRTTLAEFGKLELDAFKPLLLTINGLFDSIRSLSPETKKFLVIFGGIAAAVGPLLALAGTILPAIGTGFALLTGPIGLIVAGLTAIGVVIYKNWEPIKGTLIDIANYFIDLYNESTVFRIAVEAIVTNFKNVLAVGKFVFQTLGNVIGGVATAIKDAFTPLGELIKAVLTGDIQQIPVILAAGFRNGFAPAKELIADINEDFKSLKGVISNNIEEGLNNALRGKKYELLSKNVSVDGVTEKVADAVSAGLEQGLKNGPAGTPQVARLELDTRGIAEVGTLDIGGQLADTLQAEAISEKLATLLQKMVDFRDGAREILQSAAQDFISGFGQIVGAIAAGNAGFSDLGGFLLSSVGQVLINLGKLAIQTAVTIKGIKAALESLNPVVAAIAGAAAIALGAYIKSQAASFAGNYAGGGIVPGSSFSGDKLIAGVNSGELILNVAQQKNLANVLSKRNTIILQPSLDMDPRKFRIMLNEVDTYNGRTS